MKKIFFCVFLLYGQIVFAADKASLEKSIRNAIQSVSDMRVSDKAFIQQQQKLLRIRKPRGMSVNPNTLDIKIMVTLVKITDSNTISEKELQVSGYSNITTEYSFIEKVNSEHKKKHSDKLFSVLKFKAKFKDVLGEFVIQDINTFAENGKMNSKPLYRDGVPIK